MCKTKTVVTVLFAWIALAGLTYAQTSVEAAEQQLVRLINQERAKAGAPPVEVNARLENAARAHSQKMAERRELSHQVPGEPTTHMRLVRTGLRFNTDGENCAVDHSVEGAHQGLMDSRPHRANMLNPAFNAVGVGVAWRGEELWVTQDFARLTPDMSVAEAENAASKSFDTLRKKLSGIALKRLEDPRLRKIACDMASADNLDTETPLQIPHVRMAVAFTASDPSKLPDDVNRLARQQASAYSIGACSASSATYSSPVYWVVMVTYF